MTQAEIERAKAAVLQTIAEQQTGPAATAEFQRMALEYLLLAEQAEQNARDLHYPPSPAGRSTAVA